MVICPLCQQHDEVEPLDDGRYLCGPCNRAWYPERPARLYDPGPTTEQRRRDLA